MVVKNFVPHRKALMARSCERRRSRSWSRGSSRSRSRSKSSMRGKRWRSSRSPSVDEGVCQEKSSIQLHGLIKSRDHNYSLPLDEKRRSTALERLALLRRQEREEMAFRAKVVEEEEQRKRIEEGVAGKLEEELERRREEIEDEVERRVAAAKLEMEVDGF